MVLQMKVTYMSLSVFEVSLSYMQWWLQPRVKRLSNYACLFWKLAFVYIYLSFLCWYTRKYDKYVCYIISSYFSHHSVEKQQEIFLIPRRKCILVPFLQLILQHVCVYIYIYSKKEFFKGSRIGEGVLKAQLYNPPKHDKEVIICSNKFERHQEIFRPLATKLNQ